MAGEIKWRVRFDFKTATTASFLLCFVLYCLPCETSGKELSIVSIQDGQEIKRFQSQDFCYYNHLVPGWKETWTRIQIRVRSSKQLKVTVVQDEEMLRELQQFSLWTLFNYFLKEHSNETTIGVSLFSNKTCFRVDPADAQAGYTVQLLRRFDIYLFMVFFAGLLLFFYAETLSRSQVFYYSAGMSTGMIASLVILIFVVARFLPKKSPFYILVAGGWSFSVYLIQLVFRNLQVILREHWHFAIGYVAVVGFVSFAVCYRHGPLTEVRSINILTWTLQIAGLLLVYAGIQVQQVALALIIAAFCSKNLEHPIRLALTLWRRLKGWQWSPEPPRLLTEEEYQKQAEVETQRALEELRSYCSSPEFSAWRAVSRLQSPKRFADFVEGSPHLDPNEVSVHAQEYSFLFDDEEDFDDEEEEEENERRGWKREELAMDLPRNHRSL